ncbi:MAG: TssN family type VI secretion system protein [Moheibacter sp.]
MRPTFRPPSLKDLLDPTILIIIAILLIVGIILSLFFTDKVTNFKTKYRRRYWAYLITSLLVFALIAFLGQSKTINSLFGEFVFYQIAIFIMGVIHAVIYRSYFDKFELENIWLEAVFNLLIAIFCTIPFLIVYTYLSGTVYAPVIATGMLVFLIPTWIYATYLRSISIPAKVFHTWQFPSQGSFHEPKDDEFRDVVVITFVFYKTPNSTQRTEFRAKAPIRMDFGRLFYHFANDYNTRNPDSPLQFLDENGQLQHWVFYLKPKWYGVSKYIDPKYTIYMNGIEEDSVVICQRTQPQKTGDWKDDTQKNDDNNQKEEQPQEAQG